MKLNGCVLIVLGCMSASSSDAASGAQEPAALVAFVEGRALATAGEGVLPREIRLFDLLSPGTSLEVQAGGRLEIVFYKGSRYQLGETARAVVQANGLLSESPAVHRMADVATLPALSPPPSDWKLNARPGADRRSSGLHHLSPCPGMQVLADEVTLRFDPVPQAAFYQARVEDQSLDSVFQVRTDQPRVQVPAGLLKPGAVYFWSVQTIDASLTRASSDSEIHVLPAVEASKRGPWKAEADRTMEPASLALLARIDLELGLLDEAREELSSALGKAPGNPALTAALAELEGGAACP